MNKYLSKSERESLTRDIHPMPKWVEDEIKDNNVADAYRARPAYQKNDYIGWILRAKREETQQARVTQMIDELKRGVLYMKMDYPAK